jgi:hypothetical protein
LIRLSYFSRHAEILIQRTRLETTFAEGIEPSESRAMKLLNRRSLDLDGAAALMLRHYRPRRRDAWTAAYSAALLLMTDEEFSDFSILDAVFSRTANRLAARMMDAAKAAAVDEPDVADEMAILGSGIIMGAVEVLSKYRHEVGYQPADAPAWKTRHMLQLPPSAGIQDEGGAYMAADFSPLERRVLEQFFAKRFPPIGAQYSLSAVAADVFSRYGDPDSEGHMLLAVKAAERIFDHALSQIEPARR